MINVLLLNNTENYHNGCKQVIRYFKNHFISCNLSILGKKHKELPDFKNYDLIILNGEGSIHHDSKKMIRYLEYMNAASKKNVITMVVNTVWFENSEATTKLLESIDYVSVREISSKNEILKYIDKDIDVTPDLSYFIEVPYSETKKYNIVSGNKFLPKKQRDFFYNIGEDTNIDIFSENWEDIVNKLRNSNILVTGRHHEMYAACKARCKFIVLDGNSHKNSGFLKTFGTNIPCLKYTSSNDEIIELLNRIENYQKDFENMYSNLDTIKSPNFIDTYNRIRND